MAQLDLIDQEAIREERRLYMADLEATGRKMEELVAFWQNCGLVTGTRIPPSPHWPDPRAKLRDLISPDYLSERRHAIEAMSGINDNERTKRVAIEFARWKEAVLHLHCDPLTSKLDTFEPPLRSNVAFHGEWLKDEKRWKRWEPSKLQKREVI